MYMLTYPLSSFDLSSRVKLEVICNIPHKEDPLQSRLVGRWAGCGVELLAKGAHLLARRGEILTRYEGRLDLRDEHDTQIESFITLQLDLLDGVDSANVVAGDIAKGFPTINHSLKSIVFVRPCPAGIRMTR